MNKKFYIRICTLFLVLLTAPINSQAAPGGLDFTFDGDGKVTTQIGGSSFDGNAVAIQADGKIIVAGRKNNSPLGPDFAVVRYNTDGSLDLTFDGDGLVTTNINDNAVATAVAIQTDGQILVAGYYLNNTTSYDFAVVRYNTNGSLDTNFDGDGIAVTDINARPDFANAMAIQADGKIVVAGNARFVVVPLNFGGGEVQQSDYAVVRYNTNGSLDTAFDGDGKATADIGNFSDEATAVAIQTDGKIVLAGFSQGSCCAGTDFSLVRFNSDGAVDTSFDTDGKVTTAISSNDDRAYSVAIQIDGKIVVAGYGFIGSGIDIVVARYDSNGSLDTSFDADGIVSTNILGTDAAYAVKIQSDGKIIVAGSGFLSREFAVVRYQTNGAMDTSWGTTGVVTTDFGTIDDIGKAMAIQSDGKVVVAGHSGNRIAVARYFGPPIPIPGDLDLTFDSDGKVTTCCGNIPGSSAALQTDGKLVVAGISRNLTTFVFEIWLVRYNTNGSIDTSFGNNGMVKTDTVSDFGTPSRPSIAIQSDGKIVVANWAANSFNSVYGTYVYRYNPNGSLDPTFDNDGIVNVGGVNFTDVYLARSLAIQPDGKILVGVRHHADAVGPHRYSFGLLRFNTNGSPDATFGNNGFVFTPSLAGSNPSDDHPFGITVQTDGKIVMVGLARRSNLTTMFGVVRYNPNGSLDTSFDGDGIVTTQIGIAGDRDEAFSVGVQSDGKIVVAGFSQDNAVSASVAVVRYNPNGSLDTSFDGDGKVMTAGGYSVAEKLVIQPNGKIVVAATNGDFMTVRYNPNGSLDGTSFWGYGGIITTDFGRDDDTAFSIALQNDGKIVVVGNTGNNIAIARYIGELAAPTAGSVSVSGRVLTFNGRGIFNARVSITNQSGETQTVLTNPFGYYRFNEIPTGETYIISVAHKRYRFSNNPQGLTVMEEITEMNFTAMPK